MDTASCSVRRWFLEPLPPPHLQQAVHWLRASSPPPRSATGGKRIGGKLHGPGRRVGLEPAALHAQAACRPLGGGLAVRKRPAGPGRPSACCVPLARWATRASRAASRRPRARCRRAGTLGARGRPRKARPGEGGPHGGAAGWFSPNRCDRSRHPGTWLLTVLGVPSEGLLFSACSHSCTPLTRQSAYGWIASRPSCKPWRPLVSR